MLLQGKAIFEYCSRDFHLDDGLIFFLVKVKIMKINLKSFLRRWRGSIEKVEHFLV